MKRALVALMATFVAFSATADLVFKQGDTQIVLAESPCASQRIKFLAASAGVELPYAGVARFGDYSVGLCWGRVGELELVVIDEDGDGAKLPIRAFKVEKGV